MYIKKIIIENFKCFKGRFPLELNSGLNILVGDNEAGKSTILEAIHLVLSGFLNGRYLKSELTQDLFNNDVRDGYLESLKKNPGSDEIPLPPEIIIEIFIDGFKKEDDSLRAMFEGGANSTRQKACGVQFKIALNATHQAYYEDLVKNGDVQSIPIEYYDFSWSSFARDASVTPTKIPVKSALIDSSSNRYQNGSDVYIARILKDHLENQDKIKVEQAHRRMKETFRDDQSIKDVNKLIKKAIDISNKKVELSVDFSTKNAWENSLVTCIDDVPFHYVGKGEQCIVKTKLALSHKKSQEASTLLLEEPENHLSHTKLNQLIKYIKASNTEKQIIISTHSSFVANKLGLGNLVLLNVDKTTKLRKETRLNDLEKETKDYFDKLSGYDTLRLVLCKKAILVEGDSDELVVQKAYMINNDGKLPIEDGIDVISVGLSFLRFLEIAEKINQPVAVVTDNDGDINALEKKYSDYLGNNSKEFINIYFDKNIDNGDLVIGDKKFNYNTLEPKLLKCNSRVVFNKILKKNYSTDDDLLKYMNKNKTECALKIIDTKEKINFPEYILDAIKEYEND